MKFAPIFFLLLVLTTWAWAEPPKFSASFQYNPYELMDGDGKLYSLLRSGVQMRLTRTTGRHRVLSDGRWAEINEQKLLPLPGGQTSIYSNDMDVNEDGRLLFNAGNSANSMVTDSRAFIWTEEDQIITVAGPGTHSNLGEINDLGYAAVTRRENRGADFIDIPYIASPSGLVTEIPPNRVTEWGFRRAQNQYGQWNTVANNKATAKALNNNNAVVCDASGLIYHAEYSYTEQLEWSFIYQNGAVIKDDLPKGATDINDRNEVVGFRNGYGTWLYLPAPNYGLSAGVHRISTQTFAYAIRVKINNLGDIVWVGDYAASHVPMLWSKGTLYNLASLISAGSGEFQLRRVADINDQGQLLVADSTMRTGLTSPFNGSRILTPSPVRIEIDPPGDLNPGDDFVASVVIHHTKPSTATYTFPEGVFITATPGENLVFAETDLPHSITLSPEEPKATFSIPATALKRGFIDFFTRVEITEEGGPTQSVNAAAELLVEPLEIAIKVTTKDHLLNQTPEAEWGARAKAVNASRRQQGLEPYANLIEIEMKVTNESLEKVEHLRLPEAVNILRLIQSTDFGEPGVPLTPIRMWAPGGVEFDLTNLAGNESLENATLQPGQSIVFAWVLEAFDGNSDPEVDDSRGLEFTPLLQGGIAGRDLTDRGEIRFNVIDRPLLEWGIRPANGRTRYISGQAVRVDGWIENISTRDNKPPQDIRVMVYQLPKGNLGGGFMQAAHSAGGPTPGTYQIFNLPAEGEGSALNLSSIFRSFPTVTASVGKVRYGVRLWTVDVDPESPTGEVVVEASRQSILKKEWLETFDVTFSADRPSFTYQEECYALGEEIPQLAGVWPFLVGLNQGLTQDFTDGIIGLGSFLFESGETMLDAGVSIAAWEMRTMNKVWLAVHNDPVARQALLQEAYVQYRTFVELGVMAGEAGGKTPMVFEQFAVQSVAAMADFFHSVEKGDLKEVQFSVGKFLGANPDMLFEPLVVASNYQRMSKALLKLEGEVVDNTIRTAMRAEEARKATSVEQRLKDAVAAGRAPETALLPGDVLSDSKILDIYGVTRKQKEAIQKIAEDNGITITFRARNPISERIIREGRGYPKPQALKHKTVNQIDIDFLGYRRDAKATLELVEPPAGLLGPDGRALTDDALEDALNAELGRLSDRIGNNVELAKEVRSRMKTRAEEWNKLFMDKGLNPNQPGTINQKITTSYDADLQWGPGKERDRVKQVGAVETRNVTYQPIPGSNPRAWEMKMTGPNNGPPKSVTGDVDFMAILDESGGLIRDSQKRIEIYTQLEAVLDMQHGESWTFFLQKARIEHLKACTLGEEGAEAMVAISGLDDGTPRAAYFVDNLSVIDNPGSPNSRFLPKRKKTPQSLKDFILRRGEAKEVRRVDPSGEFMLLDGIPVNTKPPLNLVSRFYPATLGEALEKFLLGRDFILPSLLLRLFESDGTPVTFSYGGEVLQAIEQNGELLLRSWTESGGWRNVTMEQVIAKGDPSVLELAPMTALPGGSNQRTRVEILAQSDVGPTGDFFQPGDQVVINPGQPNQEIVTVRALGSLIFPRPLGKEHAPGEMIISLGRDNTDRDGDGLTGYEEAVIHGTNPNEADSDFDSIPDNVEIATGQNPNDLAPGVKVSSMTKNSGGSITLVWTGNPGTRYHIEASRTLTSESWSTVREITAEAGFIQTTTLDEPFPGEKALFFRVRPVQQ